MEEKSPEMHSLVDGAGGWGLESRKVRAKVLTLRLDVSLNWSKK